MFRHFSKAIVSLILLMSAAPALAGIDCTCRFKGEDIPEGRTICMDLPSGQVLAQCGRVLNNTAWKTLQKGCPYSQSDATYSQLPKS